MNWLTGTFAPKSQELFNTPWLAALSGAMQKIIPFILTGSLIFFYNVFRSYVSFLPDLWPIAAYSFMLITMIVAFMMTNQLMEKLKHPAYTINAGIVSVLVLLMAVTPRYTSENALSDLLGKLGPSGIAVGMVVGLFVGLIFDLYSKLNLFKNSSMPDFVTSWINTIIPTFLSLAITMVLVDILGIDINQVILSIFAPIAMIGQTLPGFILICLIPAFFYTMGISSWMFGAVTTPIFMAGIQANIDAVAAGGIATNIVTSESVFTLAFITMGGMGATLGLNLLMMFSKSKKLSTLGKIFIGPSIFNINEPVMFGAPVVFNPLLMLPMWINSIIGPVVVWFAMSTGLLNIPAKMIQVGQVPAPISSVLITEDMRAIIWYAVLFVLYLAVWYPFFKAYEKQVLLEETSED